MVAAKKNVGNAFYEHFSWVCIEEINYKALGGSYDHDFNLQPTDFSSKSSISSQIQGFQSSSHYLRGKFHLTILRGWGGPRKKKVGNVFYGYFSWVCIEEINSKALWSSYDHDLDTKWSS